MGSSDITKVDDQKLCKYRQQVAAYFYGEQITGAICLMAKLSQFLHDGSQMQNLLCDGGQIQSLQDAVQDGLNNKFKGEIEEKKQEILNENSKKNLGNIIDKCGDEGNIKLTDNCYQELTIELLSIPRQIQFIRT